MSAQPAVDGAELLVLADATRSTRTFEEERTKAACAGRGERRGIAGVLAADVVMDAQLNLAVEAERGVGARNEEGLREGARARTRRRGRRRSGLTRTHLGLGRAQPGEQSDRRREASQRYRSL